MTSESHFEMTEATASVSSSTDAGPVRIFYKDAKPISSFSSNTPVILLIHGFPETSHQFRHAIPLLTKAGYRVIAPDYRGAGYSSKPRVGNESGANYTKRLCAQDLHELMHETLGIKEKYDVVGHDIGGKATRSTTFVPRLIDSRSGMVAHAYAALYPKDIKSVIWGEVELQHIPVSPAADCLPVPASRQPILRREER
jgi:pimeloyl-ACP methyl ester carboxylesterase